MRASHSLQDPLVAGLTGFVPERGIKANPLHRQLYRWLRQAILDGDLPAGTRLPPTRVLAADCSLL
jgi:DNA-binding GntR family transcriptional regulator